jgi:hypothetical protein
MQVIRIRAEWDDEASVWVATSDDIPLAVEADSIEALEARLPGLIQDLIDGSGPEIEVPVEVVAHRESRVWIRTRAA